MALADRLELARQRVENRLLSHDQPLATCSIYADPEGFTDDKFIRDSGEWIRPVDDEVQTEISASCTVHLLGMVDRRVGGTIESVMQVRIKVALDVVDAVVGSIVRIETARDPSLEGREFKIVEVRFGTFAMMRGLICEERTRGVRGQSDVEGAAGVE